MMISRRKALSAMSAGAMAAPAVADGIAQGQMQAFIPSAGGQIGGAPMMPYPAAPSSIQDIAKRVLSTDAMRATLRSKLYREDYRHINGLDPDIATKRSWSAMAKITFQRQRIVENRERIFFEGESNAYSWLLGLVGHQTAGNSSRS